MDRALGAAGPPASGGGDVLACGVVRDEAGRPGAVVEFDLAEGHRGGQGRSGTCRTRPGSVASVHPAGSRLPGCGRRAVSGAGVRALHPVGRPRSDVARVAGAQAGELAVERHPGEVGAEDTSSVPAGANSGAARSWIGRGEVDGDLVMEGGTMTSRRSLWCPISRRGWRRRPCRGGSRSSCKCPSGVDADRVGLRPRPWSGAPASVGSSSASYPSRSDFGLSRRAARSRCWSSTRSAALNLPARLTISATVGSASGAPSRCAPNAAYRSASERAFVEQQRGVQKRLRIDRDELDHRRQRTGRAPPPTRARSGVEGCRFAETGTATRGAGGAARTVSDGPVPARRIRPGTRNCRSA